MRRSPLLLLFLGLSAPLHADSLADENARLKQQLNALQSRVEALERACPAATTAVTVQPGIAAASAPPAPPAAPPTPAPAAAAMVAPAATSVTATANLEGTPQPAVSMPAPAPKQPYANAGCDLGWFSGPKAGRWQKLSNWSAVSRGLGPEEVEAAIGVEHYNVELYNGRTQWQYGRCSSSYEGAVEFLNGRVVSVVPPDR